MPMRRGGRKMWQKTEKKRNKKQQEVRNLGLKQKPRQKTRTSLSKRNRNQKPKTTIKSNEHPTRRESCK
jgi:hypothetical protein